MVTLVLVEMFTVSQHVSGTSTQKHGHKQPEKKKLKGALVSVASKDSFWMLCLLEL